MSPVSKSLLTRGDFLHNPTCSANVARHNPTCSAEQTSLDTRIHIGGASRCAGSMIGTKRIAQICPIQIFGAEQRNVLPGLGDPRMRSMPGDAKAIYLYSDVQSTALKKRIYLQRTFLLTLQNFTCLLRNELGPIFALMPKLMNACLTLSVVCCKTKKHNQHIWIYAKHVK